MATQIHCIYLSATAPLHVMACYLCWKSRVSAKQMGQFLEELKRRNDLPVAIAYQWNGERVRQSGTQHLK